MSKQHVRSIIISDVHLGTKESRAQEAIEFLKAYTCDTLILNGDIVDGWALKSGGRWRDAHTKFVRTVLKKLEKDNTEVIYVRGNHDEFLERFLPVACGRLQVVQEYIHKTDRGDYLVVHGDGFDSVTTNYRFVAKIGSVGYSALLFFNRLYNRWRAFRGKPYYSVSKRIKAGIKSAVAFVDRYEDHLQVFACSRKCVGIICGHIHTPSDKRLGEEGVHYLNSGDWVESMSGIIEYTSGDFELVHYQEWKAGREARRAERQREEEAAGSEDNILELPSISA